MAFPATNWFRNTLIKSMTLPVTTGSASSTVELANATRLPFVTVYTNSLTGADFNNDTGYASTPWTTTNEVAASGSYVQGSATGGNLSSTPTFALSGNNVLMGPTNVNASWTTVTWSGGGAGQGCLVSQQPHSSAVKFGIAAFLFTTALTPTTGTVTITWATGIIQFA